MNQSGRMDKTREALAQYPSALPGDVALRDAALAEVEEWETRLKELSLTAPSWWAASETARAEAAEARLKDADLLLQVIAANPKLVSKIEVVENGCWEWRGYRAPHGYAQVYGNGQSLRAHRVTYEIVNGPIPEGLQIDHLCRNIGCVNPAHLEAVTAHENTMRSEGVTAKNARKTHCVHGHEFTPENTIMSKRGRNCRACHNERAKLRKRRLRAEIDYREDGKL